MHHLEAIGTRIGTYQISKRMNAHAAVLLVQLAHQRVPNYSANDWMARCTIPIEYDESVCVHDGLWHVEMERTH